MKKSVLKICGILIILMGIYNVKSYAAISATSKTVDSGSTVSISISSDIPVLSYKVTMTDAGGLTFSGSSGGTGAGTTTITDAKSTGMRSLAVYTFTVPTVESDTKYNVKFLATAMEDENFNPVPDNSTVAVITVRGTNSGNENQNNGNSNAGNTNNENNNGETTKSSNANLQNLGITPNDFKGFKANIDRYDVTVPYDVESVKVYAYVEDSKAKITSGTGTKKLKEGSNSLAVVVTAEDGTKKTYTINVLRKSEEEEMTPNVVEEPEDNKPKELRLTAISLQNNLNLKLSPTFNSEIFEYNLEVENDLEKLELSGIPNVNSAKVEIEGNEELVEGENIIKITVKAEEYKDVIYKIKVTKKVADTKKDVQEEKNEVNEVMADVDKSSIDTKKIIIISIIAIVIILIIIMVVIKRRKNNKRLYASYYDYYNDVNLDEGENIDISKEIKNDNVNKEDEFISEENIFDSINNTEIPEGYTAEIEQDTNYEDKPRRKRGKGKHF